jgi:hypothetical protein
MQLWEYGYFVVQELDNVYTKTVGQPWDLTRMGTATDELKLDIAIKATGIDVIDITEDYKVFNVLKYCQLPFFQEQKYLPRIAVKNTRISDIQNEGGYGIHSLHAQNTRGEIKILEDFIKTI